MRKFMKLSLLVAAVAVVGLVAFSCEDPNDDDFTVKLTGGGEGAKGGGTYKEGDDVNIDAGAAPLGMKFDQWTSSPTVDFDDPKSPKTAFTMPGEDVNVGAWWKYDVPVVRYTWESKAQSLIQSIAASYNDVKSWYEDVYMGEDYIEEDASDVPKNDGSPRIPDNIYSSTLKNTKYKGTYLGISAGKYTAVCTVDDPKYDNIADIVANYEIAVVGGKEYFEIAFDVLTFLAGEDDLGWFKETTNDPDQKPRLEKIPGKKTRKEVPEGRRELLRPS